MKRTVKVALVALSVLALLALAGCSAPATGGMGGGSTEGKVWGYVASADTANIQLAEKQVGKDTLVVEKVVAPEDAWLVVHAEVDGKPGGRVGLKQVSKGESTNVEVPLAGVSTPNVIVALHADRDQAGRFDFDMMKKESSPDRPFFVDSKEVAKVVAAREVGVTADEGAAAIEVSPQPGATTEITVDKAVAPTDAWVVVHLDEGGKPGARVGLARIPAGESTNVKVALDPVKLTDKLLVAVHADRLAVGQFEFDMMNKVSSADQPFFVGGKEVAVEVPVK